MNSMRKAPPLDKDSCIEILLRLPIESITRFQIVCKRWLSLISSENFRRLHALRHHRPPECLILPSLNSSMFYFNLITKPTKMNPFNINIPNHPKICSSCNGLLLLRDDHDCCHVYNPITKQSRKISLQSTDSGRCTHVFRLHLVFDPSKSIHYKIICIRVERVPMPSPPDTQTYQMEVFDSESGTWNVRMEPFTGYSGLRITYSVHSKNMIYGRNNFLDGSIYCFDIDKNVMRFLTCPMPRNLYGLTYSRSLHESNGRLYYIFLSADMESHESAAVVWELKGDDEWSLKYRHRVPRLPKGFGSHLLRFITETSTLLIYVPPGKIVAYSFLDTCYDELLDLKSQSKYNLLVHYRNIHQFRETLAPV